MSYQAPTITLSGLSFAWPDGHPVFHDLDAVFGVGSTGLIGANGAGKTTLLRLIASELTPISGSVSVQGTRGYLPQRLTLDTDQTVAELMGVASVQHALAAIEAGSIDQQYFDTVGELWDIHARVAETLARFGLPDFGLDRRVGTLSGGETILTALAGFAITEPDVLLLDEPTNNLDGPARQRLYEILRQWRGSLLISSHDVELLNLLEHTAELRDNQLTLFGGPYDAYREYVDQQQAAARQALATAEARLKTEQRQRQETQIKLARRKRYANTDFANKRKPKIIMNLRKQEAQVSAGKLRTEMAQKVEAAEQARDQAAEQLRADRHISIELPDPQVPRGRVLAELTDQNDSMVTLQGPARIALTGPNGAGKTRLLESLVSPGTAPTPVVHAKAYTDRIAYLPQRIDHLAEEQSVFDAVRAVAPQASPQQVRANLAGFLFRGDRVHRKVSELSGGERFRAALATVLLTEPPPQLLVLDEPTNNLDLDSVQELGDALAAYHGGLIVVSHDEHFLRRLGITTWLVLAENTLTEVAPGE